KWVFLAGIGAITCLLGRNIGGIVAVPGGADLSLSTLGICVAIASACGYPLSESFLAEKSSQLTAPDSSLTSSMYRDQKEEAPGEVDSILGDLIERGRKHGASATLLQAAFVMFTIYQQGARYPEGCWQLSAKRTDNYLSASVSIASFAEFKSYVCNNCEFIPKFASDRSKVRRSARHSLN
ncbi:MAG TPA: ketopantoate reductase C-terminal domain-containing protein, partial [Acidobacteriaceae bacterium]|nr:ketopantoate reductase C-terminal domain-containing protein [Acidobacteriaceae bacterium]